MQRGYHLEHKNLTPPELRAYKAKILGDFSGWEIKSQMRGPPTGLRRKGSTEWDKDCWISRSIDDLSLGQLDRFSLVFELTLKTPPNPEVQMACKVVLNSFPPCDIEVLRRNAGSAKVDKVYVEANGKLELRITVDHGDERKQGYDDQKLFAPYFPRILSIVQSSFGVGMIPAYHFALSGGGFRATLYHLGVLTALRSMGLLGQLHSISSVSGGSILAGHLMANWGRYAASTQETFDACAIEVIQLTQRDFRRRLILQVMNLALLLFCAAISVWQFNPGNTTLTSILTEICKIAELVYVKIGPTAAVAGIVFLLLFSRGRLPGGFFSRSMTYYAIQSLNHLFRKSYKYRRSTRSRGSTCNPISVAGIRMANRCSAPVGGIPYFFFNTTSLTHGSLCAFSVHGFIQDITTVSGKLDKRSFLPIAGTKLGKVVIASAAFPVLFAPVKINLTKSRGQGELQWLADGGIHDNSGLELLENNRRHNEPEFLNLPQQNLVGVIASDAASGMDSLQKRGYSALEKRLGRSIEIMMESRSRATHREVREFLARQGELLFHLAIEDPTRSVDTAGSHLAESKFVRALAGLPTDLDSFDDDTVSALVQHGYVKCLVEFARAIDNGQLNSRASRAHAVNARAAEQLMKMGWYSGNGTESKDLKFLNTSKLEKQGVERTPYSTILEELSAFFSLCIHSWPGRCFLFLFLLLIGIMKWGPELHQELSSWFQKILEFTWFRA